MTHLLSFTLRSISIVSSPSLFLRGLRIKFWAENPLSHPAVWTGHERARWASLIMFGHSSLWYFPMISHSTPKLSPTVCFSLWGWRLWLHSCKTHCRISIPKWKSTLPSDVLLFLFLFWWLFWRSHNESRSRREIERKTCDAIQTGSGNESEKWDITLPKNGCVLRKTEW